MAVTHTLDIYLIQIKKIKPGSEGKPLSMRKTEKEICNFKELYSILDVKNPLTDIYQKIVEFFDSKFVPNARGTKSISVPEESFKGFSSEDAMVWGVFLGGPTGTYNRVYENSDSSRSVRDLNPDNTVAEEHYFIAYIPNDRSTGILAIQASNTSTVTMPFKECFSMIMGRLGFKVNYMRYIPREYIKNYLQDTLVQYITIYKARQDKENPVKPEYKEFERAAVQYKISNLDLSVKGLIEKGKDYLTDALAGIGIDVDENTDEIEVHYGGNSRKPATASIENLENILPAYEMPVPEIDDTTHHPKWNVVHNNAKNIIKEIIKERNL